MSSLRDRREQLGMTQGALAELAGTSQPQIRRLEAGERKLTKEWAERLAPHLNCSAEDLMFGARRAALDSFPPEVTPGADLVGARDLPIYGSAMGGNGQLVVDTHPIEYVKRPSILEGVRDAYGIRIVGDSMEPAYWQGDLALVHPHLPPERDTDVILFDAPPDGQTEAAIKRLTGYSGTEWRLRQYNPPRDWTELRVDWPVCHRVVGKYARR